MNPAILTEQTMQQMTAALQKPNADIVRTFVQPATATEGLIGYDLEAPAKHLVPVITPLRNKIPRDVSGFGTQANWQVIDQINPTNVRVGVSEGRRGGAISYHTARYMAAFVEYGLENWVTFKADLASKNFMDLKSEAQLQLLWSLMIQEEFLDLGGVSTTGLGTTPTPVLTDVGSGGSLTNGQTYKVGCVALTLAGYQQIAGTNMGRTGQTEDLAVSLAQTITRANMDDTTETIYGGVAQPSAIASQAAGAASDSISASVTPVDGAVAYAWYFGQTDSDHMYLYSVTPESIEVFTAVPASTRQKYSALAAADYSADELVYDGILTQVANSSIAYKDSLNAKLTTDNAGGITELITMFQYMYDRFRLSIDELYVNSQQLKDMNTLIIKNGGAPLIRYNMDVSGHGGGIDVGVSVATVLNPYTNKKVQVVVHPNMPPGTMLGWSNSVPYPLNDVGQIIKKKLRRDYYSIEWPLRTRRYEYGIYADGVLQCYAPFAFSLVNCITPGV
ncbi:MAG: hypothetical protein ABFD81_19110 [Syntrophaceae bacterium]